MLYFNQKHVTLVHSRFLPVLSPGSQQERDDKQVAKERRKKRRLSRKKAKSGNHGVTGTGEVKGWCSESDASSVRSPAKKHPGSPREDSDVPLYYHPLAFIKSVAPIPTAKLVDRFVRRNLSSSVPGLVKKYAAGVKSSVSMPDEEVFAVSSDGEGPELCSITETEEESQPMESPQGQGEIRGAS